MALIWRLGAGEGRRARGDSSPDVEKVVIYEDPGWFGETDLYVNLFGDKYIKDKNNDNNPDNNPDNNGKHDGENNGSHYGSQRSHNGNGKPHGDDDGP